MATLKDIAKITGVSVPTVSKVLNNKSQKCASPETQNRIWQAVHDLGYTPNMHAKKLASFSNVQTVRNLIAICMCEEKDFFSVRFYDTVRRNLEMAIFENKYIPYTCGLETVFRKESPLQEQQIAAVILVGEPSSRTIANLSKITTNILVLSLEDGMIGCDKVFCSFQKAVKEAISTAFRRNSRKIFYIGPEASTAITLCEKYPEKANVHVIHSDNTVSGGYVAGLQIRELLSERDCIICEGREIAIGIQKSIQKEERLKSKAEFLILDDRCNTVEPFSDGGLIMDLGDEECVNLGLQLLMDRIRRQHIIPAVYEVDNYIYVMEADGKEWQI